jgi:membrane protease YdiL (CAAX protease family)
MQPQRREDAINFFKEFAPLYKDLDQFNDMRIEELKMFNISPIIFSQVFGIALILICSSLFVRSHCRKNSSLWGFVIVVTGIFMYGIGYHFYDNQILIYSINLSLVISLIGVLFNVNNIQDQFRIRSTKEFLYFFGIGLISGLIFGYFTAAIKGSRIIEPNLHATVFALLSISLQLSVAEEILIRGYLFNHLIICKFSKFFALIFQAMIFTFTHFTRYWGDWVSLSIVFLLGLTAGYFTLKNNSLFPAIFLHVSANLTATILSLI